MAVMGALLVAHTTAWLIYKRRGWKLPRLLPFPRLEVYFAMFMLAPLATCAGRACCTSILSWLIPVFISFKQCHLGNDVTFYPSNCA